MESVVEGLLGRFAEGPVDTRSEEGPEGRTYLAPFAEVWDLLLREIRGRRGWRLVHRDEERGLLTAVCRAPLRRGADDLTAFVRLDENGLTRVDLRSAVRGGGEVDFGANRRRVERLLRRLDRAVGEDRRLR